MRLFVGLFPSAAAVEHLSNVSFQSRTIPPSRWHITVAFLGEVSSAEPALEALAAVDRTVGELCLSGGGHFGSILWAGVDGDLDGLTKLNRAVRREMRARRIHPDDRRFHPHLTLSRRGDPADLDLLRDYRGPMWTSTPVLVASKLGPQPDYTVLSGTGW